MFLNEDRYGCGLIKLSVISAILRGWAQRFLRNDDNYQLLLAYRCVRLAHATYRLDDDDDQMIK